LGINKLVPNNEEGLDQVASRNMRGTTSEGTPPTREYEGSGAAGHAGLWRAAGVLIFSKKRRPMLADGQKLNRNIKNYVKKKDCRFFSIQ
jgi:hypothetical protein